MTDLHLRRASISRASDQWSNDDFDVFDGAERVGRIFRLSGTDERWWWDVTSEVTGRRNCGTADNFDEALATFKAAYERWLRAQCPN